MTLDPAAHISPMRAHSLIETHRPTLVAMLGERAVSRVRELPSGTFDAALAKILSLLAIYRYQNSIVEQRLIPGYLWMQERMISEVEMCFSTETGWSFKNFHRISTENEPQIEILWNNPHDEFYCFKRAYPTRDNNVILEAYPRYSGLVARRIYELSKFPKTEFVNLERAFPKLKEITYKPPSAINLKRFLDQVPILVKITRAASERLPNADSIYFGKSQVSLHIGLSDKNEGIFDPLKNRGLVLLKIERYFERLLRIHENEGKPEMTIEPVAPEVNTMEDLMQVVSLRNASAHSNPETSNLYNRISERHCFTIHDLNLLEGVGLEDLRYRFHISKDSEQSIYLEFEQIETTMSKSDRLEFSIDHQNDSWKLESRRSTGYL